jgi:hypothetical protein
MLLPVEKKDKYDYQFLINTIRAQLPKEDLHSYVRYLLAVHCIPTLLKLKPSSLIFANQKDTANIQLFLYYLEYEINQFGCQYSILYQKEEKLVLLIYNKDLLEAVLDCQDNIRFLSFFGYDVINNKIDNLLVTLMQRYQHYKTDFPHEIGIILGYPLKDVEDFIRYEGNNYLFAGCWKVYHNADQAKKIFHHYEKVRNSALRILIEGKSLYELQEKIAYLSD